MPWSLALAMRSCGKVHRQGGKRFKFRGVMAMAASDARRAEARDSGFFTRHLQDADPEVWGAVQNELHRQQNEIELIASENIVSQAVLDAQGSLLTNKYAEGYPGKRYYGGCAFVDIAEHVAIERAKQLFGAEYANVQPHSGSQANQAAYLAYLKPGYTLLGMSLTHGAAVNVSGKLYHAISYGLDADEVLDYAECEKLAREHNPRVIVAGASAYSLKIDWQRLRHIADEVDAILMADVAHYAGLIATGHYPSPIGIADVTTSTTHKTLRGPVSYTHLTLPT